MKVNKGINKGIDQSSKNFPQFFDVLKDLGIPSVQQMGIGVHGDFVGRMAGPDLHLLAVDPRISAYADKGMPAAVLTKMGQIQLLFQPVKVGVDRRPSGLFRFQPVDDGQELVQKGNIGMG